MSGLRRVKSKRRSCSKSCQKPQQLTAVGTHESQEQQSKQDDDKSKSQEQQSKTDDKLDVISKNTN